MVEQGLDLREKNVMAATNRRIFDVVIVGGGQSALAVAYFFRRTSLSVVILDNGQQPGGAWVHAWESLHLFSPSQWSSLPGWGMPAVDGYPTRDDVVGYLAQYEKRYGFSMERPVSVKDVRREDEGFAVDTDRGVLRARAVISATGTWSHPYVPDYPNRTAYLGPKFIPHTTATRHHLSAKRCLS